MIARSSRIPPPVPKKALRSGILPARSFWSLTLYNESHLFHPNSLNRPHKATQNGGAT
jgi:hypothetical protein